MKQFKVIAFTHKKASLEEVGSFHLEDTVISHRLSELKKNAHLQELMYLSTCNRVEFYFVSERPLNDEFLLAFFWAFNPALNETQLLHAIKVCEHLEGDEAVRHIFNVASSLDSMIIGEREIITQVRSAYDKSNEMGLTGDLIRLVMKKTVEVAKDIYSRTNISAKPVSVVSLAFKRLQELNISTDSKIIFVGAGQTNTTMARFLKKTGFTNFIVFNRSISNGLKLGAELNCETKELSGLANYQEGFDVLIACTGSAVPVITGDLYQTLVGSDKRQKIIIDLAIPSDVETSVSSKHNVKLISVEQLRSVAEKNLHEREKELVKCNDIIENCLRDFHEVYKIRQVELAMSQVPEKVKEIKDMALNVIFARELSEMDPKQREVLEKVLDYLEKKYISVPMKLAKEILLESSQPATSNNKAIEQPLHLN
ncbi:MAG: glutamyl-tRNA reductase [Flavobacteriales bacterium]